MVLKSTVRPINNNKNKLNSEIIFIFHLNPNAHLEWQKRVHLPFLDDEPTYVLRFWRFVYSILCQQKKTFKSCPFSSHNVQFIFLKANLEQLRETLIMDFFVILHCYSATFQTWLESELILYLMLNFQTYITARKFSFTPRGSITC